MRRTVALAFLLASGIAAAGQIDVEAPWRGWSSEQGRGEISLRVPASDVAGPVAIALQAGAQRVDSEVVALRGVPTTLRLPAPGAMPISVTASTADGAVHTGRFEFQHSEHPILAWVSASTVDRADADVHLLAVAAVDLPHLAYGYDNIAGVAIDDASLKALDDAQALALLQHVRDCGFTMLLGVAADAAGALGQAAGCGGRQLIVATAAATPAEALALFKTRELTPALSDTAYRALAPDNARLAVLQAALLAYTVAASAALLLLRRTGLLWAVPALATLLLGIALWLTPVREQALVWAEAHSGDAQARFDGRLRLRALAPLRAELLLPKAIERARSCDANAPTATRWDAQQQRSLRTTLPLRLLATDDFCFAGNFPVSYQARTQWLDDGTLLLANSGAAAWDDAQLLWRGKVYHSGNMAAAATRRIREADGVAATTAAERVGLQRLAWNEAGLLLPLQLRSLAGAARDASGWLFLRMPLDARVTP